MLKNAIGFSKVAKSTGTECDADFFLCLANYRSDGILSGLNTAAGQRPSFPVRVSDDEDVTLAPDCDDDPRASAASNVPPYLSPAVCPQISKLKRTIRQSNGYPTLVASATGWLSRVGVE